ncbi:acetylornithine and succinylornithine aminotransferase [Pirellula staleyi DSM 6068]|uniref:Acetylornithine aminotransferase n=1 Tax=Pirellula staleyi (strain ATCC 27377 / DSM 6068 / ICPB 4128) TaxID=530564 RepID=D2R6P7_PIRSD|nr:aspartate aminotransferase family protein [Pirellula staleyi]ADB17347.1 acetylornithine and succinylornithine aminotransferase [Pirellula staleyi DSM 6068]
MATTHPHEVAPLSSADTVELFKQYVIGNYTRYPVNLVRGEGSLVWDAEGNRYLDFFPGWGCNLLGHCPEKIVRAVQEQVATLIHVPNTWHMDVQGRWAQMLSQRSFGGKAFFCNSGTEANEAAIKLARLHAGKGRYKIITFTGGFHGRTFGSLSATAQPKYHEGLGPMVAGFLYAPHGDLAAASSLVDDETCAIMIEPIQGEGGVKIPSKEFLEGLRKLCDERGLLLIFDEVQTGCGRTGQWFGYQHFGVEPDLITLAKSLCGGIAGGALLAKNEIAPALRPGMHAATFGGNPIAARAGIAAIEMIEEEGLLAQAVQLGHLFERRMQDLQAKCDLVREVRVAGVMVGVELSVEGAQVVKSCLERKLLVNCTQGNVIRLLPAMNLPEEQAEEGCDILCDVIQSLPRA